MKKKEKLSDDPSGYKLFTKYFNYFKNKTKISLGIPTLKNDINYLDKVRRDHLTEARVYVRQRDLANTKVSEYIELIKKLRKKRDEINAEIKKNKECRTKIFEQIKKLRHNLGKLIRDRRAFYKDLHTKASSESLELQLECLEFEFETSSMTLEEEKAFWVKFKKLKKELDAKKKVDKYSKDISELLDKIDVLRDEAQQYHSKVQEYAQLSQEIHNKLLEYSRQIDPLRKVSNESHEKYIFHNNWAYKIGKLIEKMRAKLFELKAEATAEEIMRRERHIQLKAHALEREYKSKSTEKLKIDFDKLKLIYKAGGSITSLGKDVEEDET
jgi:uncharacterized coiled-coil DUF342 family protein